MDRGHKLAIAREVDGVEAQKHVIEITKYHRGLGATGYERAAAYLTRYLERLGLDVTSVDSPLDNRTRVGSYVNPLAWEPVDATIRMVEPELETLVTFVEAPTCIRSWSASTGADGVTAELVYVGDGLSDADYEGRDVAGKIVFVDQGRDWRIHQMAVEKYGAIGFISDDISPITPPHRTRETFCDAVLWFTLAERQLDGNPNRGWGVSVSPRVGDRLRQALASGPVKIWARVITRMGEGMMRNPLATIPGRDLAEEEVLLVAHLCHTRPGAVDNAAGCAHITEVARTLQVLIDRGDLPRPRRSIKFLYGPEGHCGNVYFDQNRDRLQDIHASLCSHVGGDPEQLKVPLAIMRTSAALPSYVNDLCEQLLDEIPAYFPTPGLPIRNDVYGGDGPERIATNPFAWITLPRFMGGDSIQNNAWGVPSIEMCRKPNIFWHTPMDTWDKVSPEELAKLGWAYAVAAHTIADAGYEETLDLMRLVTSRSAARVRGAGRDAIERAGEPDVLADRISYLAGRDVRAIASVLPLGQHEPDDKEADLQGRVRRLQQWLATACEDELDAVAAVTGGTPSPVDQSDVRPRRLGEGLPDMKFIVTRLADAFPGRHPLQLLGYVFEVANLADGSRSIAEIARVVGHELGLYEPGLVKQMVDELAALGIVEISGCSS